ncbi:uridine kinase [Microlunatus speluncae]|uniref:uridine kinase n=1 Tax=Microlunatus speluncae TaxID=2594267 RepID=UPI00126645CF|nr:uridine kinase [Microlunatus speluncae]
MRVRAIGVDQLVEELVARLASFEPDRWLRVAVDGQPATEPGRLADALVAPLRVLGRDVLRVSAADFLRPASLRFERGKQDAEAFYEDWLDANAIARELLDPLDPGGTGRVLPSLWDTERDRATRADYVALRPGAVVILDGTLLLGRWLPFEFTVHLALTPAARERRLPPEERWTLPAYERYDDEVDPETTADVVVRWNSPDRPTLLDPT